MRAPTLRLVLATLTAAGGAVGLATPAFATASPVAGTYTVTDLGQGGWTGGPLYADETVGGGGGFSLSTPDGQVVEKIVGGVWLPLGPDAIHLCLDLVGIKNAPPSGTFCVDLPVTGTPVVVSLEEGEQTLVRVSMH
jgi:hypothetical protein